MLSALAIDHFRYQIESPFSKSPSEITIAELVSWLQTPAHPLHTDVELAQRRHLIPLLETAPTLGLESDFEDIINDLYIQHVKPDFIARLEPLLVRERMRRVLVQTQLYFDFAGAEHDYR